MATETTMTSAKAWSPDLTAVAPHEAIPEALVLTTSTVAGTVEGDEPAVRVQYVDDAAAGFVAEGSNIPEADPDLAEVLVHTGKVAQLLRLSREQFGQPNSSMLLSESVRRAVTKAANIAYLAQPHPGSITQSVTVSGTGTYKLSGNGTSTATIAHDAASATVQTAVRTLGGPYAAATVTGSAGGPYTVTTATAGGLLYADSTGLTGGAAIVAPTGIGTSPAPGLLQMPGILDGGAVSGDLDALIDLQATIAGNDGNPSHILLSPTAWASLRKIKDEASSARNLLGAGTEDTVPSLLNIPVLVSNAVPANSGVMLDKTAIVSAVGPVNVAVSDQMYFAHDSMGVRCTFRFGQNVVHPERVGRFTVTNS